MAGFIAVMRALPALVALLRELNLFLKEAFGDTPEKFLTDSAEAFRKLNAAKTSEERSHAALEVQRLLSRIGN